MNPVDDFREGFKEQQVYIAFPEGWPSKPAVATCEPPESGYHIAVNRSQFSPQAADKEV